MQIQISWLLQKPTDLDLHYLLEQGMSCSARGELNLNKSTTLLMCVKTAGLVANIVDPDQIPQMFAEDCGSEYLGYIV